MVMSKYQIRTISSSEFQLGQKETKLFERWNYGSKTFEDEMKASRMVSGRSSGIAIYYKDFRTVIEADSA